MSDAPQTYVIKIEGRVVGRPWLWVGVVLIRAGAWFCRRFGVDVRGIGFVAADVQVDEGPWSRVYPRKP